MVDCALAEMQASDAAAKAAVEALNNAADELVDSPTESPATRKRMDEYLGLLCDVVAGQFQHLYVQGAKDCVSLLRELGVIR